MSNPAELLRLNIIEELKRDPRVDDSSIVVGVFEGTVTLTGTVSSYRTREFAIMDVLNMEGVIYLQNKLIVDMP